MSNYPRAALWVFVGAATLCMLMLSNSNDRCPVAKGSKWTNVKGVAPRLAMETNLTYCESTDLGCFYFLKNNNTVLKARNNFTTIAWCLNLCNSNGAIFAGVLGSKECHCANLLEDFTLGRTAAASGCNLPCPGKPDEKCGDRGKVRAFFIKSDCKKEPVTEEDAEAQHRGCFETPQHREDFYVSAVTSPSECVQVCQRLSHPMALFEAQGECLCGRMGERFNLEHKQSSCNQSNTVQAYRTWAEDKRCGNIRLLPPFPHLRTLLASYPGSGNTWTRYLLEKASGFYTGSYYSDRSLYNTGFLGEMLPQDDYRVDLIKNHLFKDLKPDLNSSIVIVRSPYRAMLADYNYANTKGKHTGIGDLEKMKTVFTESSVEHHLRYWNRIINSVLESGRPFLVIYFEDMVSDPIRSVRKMLEFVPNPLLRPADLEDRLFCLSQETTGLQKRKTRKIPFNPFGAAVRDMINKNVVEMREVLRKAGVEEPLPPYENDPDYAH